MLNSGQVANRQEGWTNTTNASMPLYPCSKHDIVFFPSVCDTWANPLDSEREEN